MICLTEHSGNIDQLAAAMAEVQAAMSPAVKDSTNPHLKNKYADLGSVWSAIHPHLKPNGLCVMQTGELIEDAHYIATTVLHTSGQWYRGRTPVIAQGNQGVNAAQAHGSGTAYARRYGLSALFLVTTEDDDGAGAGAPHQQQPRQQRQPAKPASNGTDPAHAEDGKVCLQFKGERSDDWKKALHAAGFEWDDEKHSYRAPVTDKSVAFAQNCVTDCGEQLRWHRIPEPEAA